METLEAWIQQQGIAINLSDTIAKDYPLSVLGDGLVWVNSGR